MRIFQSEAAKIRHRNIAYAIMDYWGVEFFKDRDVLEVGCGSGAIGGYLANIGADVTWSDAREAHVKYVREQYPGGKTILADMDEGWPFNRKYNFVLHSGLLYHQFNPRDSLIAVCKNCDYLFLETEYYDTDNPSLMLCMIGKGEHKANHAFNLIGCRPSFGMIEMILTECGMEFERLEDTKYDSETFTYADGLQNTYSAEMWPKNFRGMWFCAKVRRSQPKMKRAGVSVGMMRRNR